jgi:hypothetical protein
MFEFLDVMGFGLEGRGGRRGGIYGALSVSLEGVGGGIDGVLGFG